MTSGAALFLIGCGADRAGPAVATATIGVDGVGGLSGLDDDDRGTFWAVSERDLSLVAFDREAPAAPRTLPISGVPAGNDLESVAWIGDHRLAVGTEAATLRTHDHVLLLDVGTRTAKVTGAIPVAWTIWGFDRVPANEGVEGLCATDDVLLLAGEPVLREGGTRWAPIGRYDPRREWIAYRLPLTTETGRVSALDCRIDEDILDVWAIERHFDTTRILRFEVPLTGDGQDLPPPIVVRDLAESFPRTQFPLGPPNLEGIITQRGFAWMITDGSGGGGDQLVELPVR